MSSSTAPQAREPGSSTATSADAKSPDLIRKLRRVSAWHYRFLSHQHGNNSSNSSEHVTGRLHQQQESDGTGLGGDCDPGAESPYQSPSRSSSVSARSSASPLHSYTSSSTGAGESLTNNNYAHAYGLSTLPPPLTSLAGDAHSGHSGIAVVPHSFAEILLHDDFVAELRRRNYLVMEYVRGRIPLLLEIAMGHFEKALSMERVVNMPDAHGTHGRATHAAGPSTGTNSFSFPSLAEVAAAVGTTAPLTQTQCAALTQVVLRVLSGRTGEARGGALDAFHATCGPVWDALTAHTFFETHLHYVSDVITALEDACDAVEAIVPFAMSWLPTKLAAVPARLALSFSSRAPEWLSRQVSAAGSTSSSPFVSDVAAPPPPESPGALAEYMALHGKRIQHLLMTLEALLVAVAMVDSTSADRVAPLSVRKPADSGVGGGGRSAVLDTGRSGFGTGDTAPRPLLRPQLPSPLHSLGTSVNDEVDADRVSRGGHPPDSRTPSEACAQALSHVSERAIAAFTRAFLSTTTVQRQLVEYSDYHARCHGLCATSQSPSLAPVAVTEREQACLEVPSARLGLSPVLVDNTSRTSAGGTHDLILSSPSLRSARSAPLPPAEATGEEVMLALVLEKATAAAASTVYNRSFGSERAQSTPLGDGSVTASPRAALSDNDSLSAAPQSALQQLPPLTPAAVARAASAAPCPYCARFRVVETELTECVQENLSILCLATISCAAHDPRVAECAIAYVDEQGPVFAAQATMLLAHVLTPELMAVHPPSSRGGKALEWTLSFVFGGCSGADIARVRQARRLRRDADYDRRHSDPFSLAGSERSSLEDFPNAGSHRCGEASVGSATNDCLPDAETEVDSAAALRVEYVLAASFIRCHPLMTVMGVIAETDAYGGGLTISKAVMQYACTLSQTSARLLRSPLPAARWSTPFTEAMMQGLSQLALHHPDAGVKPSAPRRDDAPATRCHADPPGQSEARVDRDGNRGSAEACSCCDSGSFSTCCSHEVDAPGLDKGERRPTKIHASTATSQLCRCRHEHHHQKGDPAASTSPTRTGQPAADFVFMPGPRETVTGTSPQEEAETPGTRTRRRCHALHWARCVMLSARTLSKAGVSTIAVPHSHFAYMHHLSERLQRLLQESNRAIVAAAAAEARSPSTPAPSTRHGVVGVGSVPPTTLVDALVDTLQSAQALPAYTKYTQRSTANTATPSQATSVPRCSDASSPSSLPRLLVPQVDSHHSSLSRTLTTTGGTTGGARAAAATASGLSELARGDSPAAGLLHPSHPPPPLITHSLTTERHEQAFADSFCPGKIDLGGLLDEAPEFVRVPLAEVVFASLFSVLEAVGDVLLCEQPRLNSIFANDVLTLLYEIRLCMMESAASEGLFGLMSALSMTSSSAMAATGTVVHGGALGSFGGNGGVGSGSGPHSTPSDTTPGHHGRHLLASDRIAATEPIVLFPEFYVVLMEEGLRVNSVVKRWQQELTGNPNHPATGLLPLLQHMKMRVDQLQMPSEAEQHATRGALRLLLGVPTQDTLRRLHGTTLHVDDLDVEGTRKEEMTPRLGVSASQEDAWNPAARCSDENLADAPADDGNGDRTALDTLGLAVDHHGEHAHAPGSVGSGDLGSSGPAGVVGGVLPHPQIRVSVGAVAAMVSTDTSLSDVTTPGATDAGEQCGGSKVDGNGNRHGVKHAIRLVGTTDDLMAMQRRAEGCFFDQCPRLSLEHPLAEHAPKQPDALLSAHLAFQRQSARWHPLTSEWTVAAAAPPPPCHNTRDDEAEEVPTGTAADSAGCACARAGRRAPSAPRHHAPVPGSCTGRHGLAEAHRDEWGEERTAMTEEDEAVPAVLLPNTLRLLESGAFGPAGGNWSFSFMHKSDTAQWTMLDRDAPLATRDGRHGVASRVDEDDAASDASTDPSSTTSPFNTSTGRADTQAWTVEREEMNAATSAAIEGLQSAEEEARYRLNTTAVAAVPPSHTRSHSSQCDCSPRRHTDSGTRHRTHRRFSPLQPPLQPPRRPRAQRRARSQPCPPMSYDAPTPPRSPLATSLHTSAAATPVPQLMSTADDTPARSGGSPLLASAPLARTPTVTGAVEVRGQSLLSMAAARKHSVKEFLRLLAAEDTDAIGVPRSSTQRAFARHPPQLSASQQTPPDVVSAGESDRSSCGDDLST